MISVKELIKETKVKKILGDIVNLKTEILTYDSKKVTNGSVFFCLKGENADGHDYVSDAVSNGAIAIVCEKKVETSVPQIIVENSRKAFAICCGNLYGNPAKK